MNIFANLFYFYQHFFMVKRFFQEGVKHSKSTDRPFPYSFLKTDDKIFIMRYYMNLYFKGIRNLREKA